MFLLDTNVVSEIRKMSSGRADKNVAKWAKECPVSGMYISAITVLELEMGILNKERKDKEQGALLRNWINKQVLPVFKDRILPVDVKVAQQCAKFYVPNPKSERDALIAATAKVFGMTLVTRNISDFKEIKIKLINPWGE
ncbi:type II toxin-antitoxin system VapC family toxin [Facilibium subflavum]|uniref:type II toxin-antitoxin system VapC family toxin n=1 Tax=Facilibium subflavum TaxID=2219058 RepID=UPI000E65A940|nr:type II toxin-antitoxin system VapC family toxin [Facilibium subflavum]